MHSLEGIFKCPVVESYGMTEASHQMTSNPLPPGIRKPGSVGIPAGPEVAIMDNAGALLEPEEEGEIVIRGPNVTLGYENNPAANRDAFTNEWFRTGDLGRMDVDGYLFISGRIKEMINRGGEKIAPREVDEVFLSHPEVAQAVSFAVQHPTLGEDLATAVILIPEAVATDLELRAYAFERLPDFKVPSRVITLDQIPKGPTGKLQRIGLAEKLASRMAVDYTTARNNTEAKLARVWENVLGIEKVGVYDNFFFIGGDSLSAIQVVVEIQELFSIELSTNFIFKYPTVAELAEYINDLN
jgi:acyl-CoA synthetase (AMP-forming)/AMP-acid ligase II